MDTRSLLSLTIAGALLVMATPAQARGMLGQTFFESLPVHVARAYPQHSDHAPGETVFKLLPHRIDHYLPSRLGSRLVDIGEALPAQDQNAAVPTAETVMSASSGTPLSHVRAIAAGEDHTCALLNNGTVSCWGSNSYRQLGNGTTSDFSVAGPVVNLGRSATAIAAGRWHTCALLDDGTVKCWGSNFSGQLGSGLWAFEPLPPVTVSGLSGVSAITAGRYHTCALLINKTVKCWGSNYYGQLGDGTNNTGYVPVMVNGLNNAIAVVAGGEHTCALLDNGMVKCWGANWYGQLGNGTKDSSTSPVIVSGISSAVALAAGWAHTCAQLSDGTVRCWGNNFSGQLGNRTSDCISTVPVTVSGLNNSTAISAGASHTCALLNDGTVRCWGDNQYGQLGNSNVTDKSTTPVVVSGLNNAMSIAAGYEHTCARLSNGTVRCWGRNTFGQLGHNIGFRRAIPTPVANLSEPATSLAAGQSHTCALVNNGTVYCWGRNNWGQLGNGTTIDRSTPVPVSGLNGVAAIAAGEYHTCALLNNGTVRCWGSNWAGQLGNGTWRSHSTPVVVSGLSNAIAIAAGDFHTCALLNDGRVMCWGDNWYGQLGDGTTDYRGLPVSVINLGGLARAIEAGANHTCALLNNGEMRCWGYNWAGQLGNGTQNNSTIPVAVNGLNNVTAISAGYSHTCALLSNGTVMCWGWGCQSGLPNRLTPTLIDGLNNVTSLSSGYYHVCALLGDRTVRCWGSGRAGQLGNGKTERSSTAPAIVVGLSDATAIGAGEYHTCARLNNGFVHCWGDNWAGQLGNGERGHTAQPITVLTASSTFLPFVRRP